MKLPANPLADVQPTEAYRRSVITGILDSYNSNYDFLAESVQNSVDAIEDAHYQGIPAPYQISITVDLSNNSLSVLDTGIGMSEDELIAAFAPHVSLKASRVSNQERPPQYVHRGYKGVGLTYLAYATDHIRLHSKPAGLSITKARMEYANAWTRGDLTDAATIQIDTADSPLDSRPRGTYLEVRFSPHTRPRSLAHLAGSLETWCAILRARTALGQIHLGRASPVAINSKITLIKSDRSTQTSAIEAEFLYPHQIERTPEFRFLDLVRYHNNHPEQTEVPAHFRRNDGAYLEWNTDRIRDELIPDESKRFSQELSTYEPHLYAFVPYQGSVWGELNQIVTGTKDRSQLYPGLIIAVNRQRLADIFEIEATRFETFSRNVLVLVHFDKARPDQGRKTVQDEVLELARAAANRTVQYLARQRGTLRPAGETPSPQQRQVERNRDDWEFNVRIHAKSDPLHLPPVTYKSTPLTEQDVIGLFNQFCSLGVFPGVQIFSTSQSKTYDSLLSFEAHCESRGLQYSIADLAPLGLSPAVIGGQDSYETRNLVVEFKNNLDGLIDDIEDQNKPKDYRHVDISVCWSTVSETFAGYELIEITEQLVDQRQFPGITHILRRNGDSHVIQVIMLERVVDLIRSGNLAFP